MITCLIIDYTLHFKMSNVKSFDNSYLKLINNSCYFSSNDAVTASDLLDYILERQVSYYCYYINDDKEDIDNRKMCTSCIVLFKKYEKTRTKFINKYIKK